MAATDEDPELIPATEDSREATVRSAAVMSGGTLLSRVTGLVRVSVTLAALGVTALSDAYNQANTTPNIIYELVLGGILTQRLPAGARVARSLRGPRRAVRGGQPVPHDRARAAIRDRGARRRGRAAGSCASTSPASRDPVRKAQEVELGTFFLRWFMPQIVFYGIGAVAAGLLTANRRFAAQMYAPDPQQPRRDRHDARVRRDPWTEHPPAIATLTWGQKTLLAAGTTFGVLAMTVALWPALRRIGFRWKLRWDWGHESVRHLGVLAKWVSSTWRRTSSRTS